MGKDTGAKAEQAGLTLHEMDRHLQEFTANGSGLQQDLTPVTANWLSGIVGTGISTAGLRPWLAETTQRYGCQLVVLGNSSTP